MNTSPVKNNFLSTSAVEGAVRAKVRTVVTRIFADAKYDLAEFDADLGATMVGYLPGDSKNKVLA